MASLTEIKPDNSANYKAKYKAKYRVSYYIDGIVKNIYRRHFNDACRELYFAEKDAFAHMTHKDMLRRKAPTMRIVMLYYIGKLVDEYENDQISESTVIRYLTCFKGLPPTFLKMRLDAMTQMIFRRNVIPTSYPYIISAIRYTNNTLNWKFNDVYPKVARTKRNIYIPTQEEVEKLIASCETPRERMFFYLAAVCGLRRSEIMALTWDKVTNTGIVVDQHIVNGAVVPGHKSGRVRIIDCDQTFFDLLDELNPDAKYLIENKAYPDRFLHFEAFWKRSIGLAFKRSGAKFTPHALRHYAISKAISNGWDILRVQRFAGHRHAQTTLDTYGHILEKAPPVQHNFNFGARA